MNSQVAVSSPSVDDEFFVWTVRALSLARSTGAPALACLAGLLPTPASAGRFALGLGARPGQQRTGLVELAMLADLALGGALRQRVGLTRPLPTLSLTLDLGGPLEQEKPSPTVVVGETSSAEHGVATAGGSVQGHSGVVGHCTATFAVPSRGEQDELPWDRPAGVQTSTNTATACTTASELLPDRATEEADRALARALHAADSASQSWGDYLLARATTTNGDDAVLSPSAVMTNRAGNVQGGVLFALAANAGAPDDAASPPWPTSATMRFLRGADAGTPITAVAELQHATRRTVFTEVLLIQSDEIRAVASLIYRR